MMGKEILYILLKFICDIGWYFRHKLGFGWNLYYWSLNMIVKITGYNYYHQPWPPIKNTEHSNRPITAEELMSKQETYELKMSVLDKLKNKYPEHEHVINEFINKLTNYI